MFNKKGTFKFKEFMNQSGFYILTGVALVAIVLTAIILPKQGKGDVAQQPDKYAPNQSVAVKETDDLRVPTVDPRMDLEDNEETSPVISQEDTKVSNQLEQNEAKAKTEANQVDSTIKEDMISETFNSTTSEKTELFHSDNDLFAWPIDNQIIYAFSDDEVGKSFINPTLERTMRSFGVFIKADDKAEVKVAADGKVLGIFDYPSVDMPETMNYPQVGKVVVVDHGNNWKTAYGLHQGNPVVAVGDELKIGDLVGHVGAPSRDFTLTGTNLYFQILKNDVPVNPEEQLDVALDIGVRP